MKKLPVHSKAITSLHFLDDTHLLTTSADGEMKIVDITTNKSIFSELLIEKGINDSSFHMNNKMICVVGESNIIYVFEYNNNECKLKCKIPNQFVNYHLCVSCGDSNKVCVSSDNKLYIYDVDKQTMRKSLEQIHMNPITSITHDGIIFQTTSLDGTIYKCTHSNIGLDIDYPIEYVPILSSDYSWGKGFVIADSEGCITFYKGENDVKKWNGYSHGNKLIPVKLYECVNGEIAVLAGTHDGMIQLYKVESESCSKSKKLFNSAIHSIDVNKNMIAIGGDDGNLILLSKSDFESN